MNKAVCITFGEQSLTHIGMKINGEKISNKGYNIKDLQNFKTEFENIGCNCELISLNNFLTQYKSDTFANVLVIRNCVNQILGEESDKLLFQNLIDLEWDKKYWDTRRQKVLNKRARYNLCFGNKSQEPDYENMKGTIIDYNKISVLKKLKDKLENICNNNNYLECEGNYYYDATKCGIGYHGDSERKKVFGISFCTNDITREINWIWYKNNKRVSDNISLKLNNGDCYIMSEKASGYDWKKSSILTLRHAAGIEGSKYLN